MTTRSIRGFTLIELSIVVLIIAILAAIAFPSYTAMMQRSRRADIVTAMGEQVLRIEKHRVDNPSYAGYALPATVSNNFYTVALSNQTASTYTITATPAGVQADDDCGTLTLAFNGGSTTTSSTGGSDCW